MLAAGAVLAGCATVDRSLALERARTTYQQAAQDPQISTYAPVALQEAQQALQQAERVWEDSEDEREVEHLAYLTEQRVAIAREHAQRQLAEEQVKSLGEQRGEVVIEARTREVKQLEEELAALKAKQTERGAVITLSDVLFEVDRADLKVGAYRDLSRLAEFLRQHPEREVLIEGHTDSTGSEAYNLSLSERRAEAVRRFLLQQGVAPERIIARGYGESLPLAPNTTAAGRQQNRRVEVVILNEGERALSRLR
jgi:outer membrane protein OmpA-like peptidoglycan-associated protein